MPAQLPPELAKPVQCLMIDNFDSFSWNLYQQLCLLGANVVVVRNDAIDPSLFSQLQIERLIVSPGPGHPKTDSGISREIIKYFAGKVPVLGVCMGLECLVDMYGGEIAYAGEIMHGKTSKIRHDARGCLKDAPQGFSSIRYHSLSADIKTLPKELAITSITEESGVIMGVRHRTYTVEAVQYHPESILSEAGDILVRNFLDLKGGLWEENPVFQVHDLSLPPFPYPSASDASGKQMSTILQKIHKQRLQDVEAAKKSPGTTPADLSTLLSMHIEPPLIQVLDRLRQSSSSGRPALMAEVKRASPSKGDIAPDANAAQQALTYALAGASVISVLTEPKWFKGSLLDMRLARQAIDSLPNRPAILRKDFIIDEYQIQEARLHGADTVLLIVAMLSVTRLKALYDFSKKLGMEPLVEVNNAEEMQAALDLGARIIGVNNRNLHNFEVDMGTTTRLADMVKGRDVILCALSGIKSSEDVDSYVKDGARAILVGESLMRAQDPSVFIRELLALPEPTAVSKKPYKPFVKICGVNSVEIALAAAEAGADFIGIVFAQKSKRYATLDRAAEITSAIRQRRSTLSNSSPTVQSTQQNLPWFTYNAEQLAARLEHGQGPLVVGVFQNQQLDEILHAVNVAQLDLVQLHGSEPLDWAKFIPIPVIRAFHVEIAVEDGQVCGLEDVARPGYHNFILLDSVRDAKEGEKEGLSGGSGKVLDWESVQKVVEFGEGPRVPSIQRRLPVVLAGGLTDQNVQQIITTFKPWGVDVSGGVETEDGTTKDAEKVKTFVQAAKNSQA